MNISIITKYCQMSGKYLEITLFVELYSKLWCRLNVLSSDHNTLLQTCITFEHLLIHINTKLYLHLTKLYIKLFIYL